MSALRHFNPKPDIPLSARLVLPRVCRTAIETAGDWLSPAELHCA